MAKITKEQVLAEIKRRQAAKLAESKRVAKPKAAAKPSVAAILEAARAKREANVIKEQRTNKGEPRTITEAIQARTKGFKNPAQRKMMETLAENISLAARTIYTETTQAGAWTNGAVGNGAGVGLVKTYFDIFFGYFPELIVDEIASTQPIKTEKAMVFYYQALAGSDKGKVTKGQVLMDPFKINTDEEYTSNRVTIKKDTATPTWGPVIPRSVLIKDFDLTWSTDTAFTGAGVGPMAGKAITGTLTEANGQFTVTIAGADAADVEEVTYQYGNKYAPTQVPEILGNVDAREITAKARTVKTNYSFQAGFGFEAQFGVKLEDKLAESAMYELKRETDLDFVFEVMNSAPILVQWNRAAGVANGLYEFHKLSFLDAVVGASNHIFKVSKRARGNVLLVGPNAQTIVETLPAFVGENYGSQLGGAKVIGKLKDIKVIAVPELDDNDWAVVYKSQNDSLDAGIIFAPYIPVVATPTVMLDDFMARKAYTTSYGKLVVNADYFVRGTIVNNPVAQPINVIDSNGDIVDDFGA